MSRVERDEQVRQEEVRQQKVKTEAQLKEARMKFGKAMDQQKTEKSNQSAQQVAQQRNAAQGRASNAALLSQQGLQAQAKFAAMLTNAGNENLQRADSEVSSRDTEMREVERNQTDDTVEVHREETREEIREEVRHYEALLAQVDPDGQGKGREGHGHDGGQGDQRDGQGSVGATAETKDAQGPRGGADAPRIPDAVLQELVKRVMVGVDQNGLGTFVIQLKNDVLGGATMQITAKAGKISAKFTVNDENTGRLLKASEGALARAFGRKGMLLESMQVETRPR